MTVCGLWVAALLAAGPGPVEKVVAVWPAGLFEVRVAFDRPVDPPLAAAAVGLPIVFEEAGKAGVAPSDHRATLRVAAARLDGDGRILVLTTDPHPRAGSYALDLPAARVRVSYELSGAEASWEGEGGAPGWTDWFPTLDPRDVVQKLGGLPGFGPRLNAPEKPGRLTLTTLLTLPKGPFTLLVASDAAVEATLAGEEPAEGQGTASARFRGEGTGEPAFFTLTVPTAAGRPLPGVRVTFGAETPGQAVGRERTTLPWVPPAPPAPAPLADVPDLKGGDPARGAVVFAGMEAKCANCHKVRGVGGEVGPDLSGLAGKDRLAVYRDIAEPSARIHPDYVSFTVALKDGKILVGTVRAQGADAVRVTDTEARTTVVPRAEVEEFRPSATSIMPVGLAGAIGPDRLRDLIAFLTATPAQGVTP